MQAFDLDTFIASNKKGNVGRWLCPIAGCGKSAAPPDLYISAWMDDASLEHPYVPLILLATPTDDLDRQGL